MRVLAIETSCDETAAAVVEGPSGMGHGAGGAVRVLSSVVASQADLHARTEGVVPEVAARAHVEAITYVIDDALRAAQLRTQNPEPGTIDAVAVTTEPGLKPALVVGETAGRALAAAWGKPFLSVNHLAGHMAAAWLVSGEGVGSRVSGVGKLPDQPAVEHQFPIVALVVSGGHTQLWLLDIPTSEVGSGNLGGWRVRLLGQTRDDAAGEAFDKIARLLGLPYPGGPALAKLAEGGDACAFAFPRPMMDSNDDDFSFSGLKTAVYYAVREMSNEKQEMRDTHRGDLISHSLFLIPEQQRCDVAASAQEAIVDVLVTKTVNAAACEGAAEVILTGGVATNQRLRQRLLEALGTPPPDSPSERVRGIPLIVPHTQFCTDNAAMIGAAAVLGLRLPPTA